MPAHLEFALSFTRSKARRAAPDDPMRLLVIGDFSARARAERPPLASRPTHRVDADNLDQVLKRLAPRLGRPGGEIVFGQLDDFHPDRLYARLDLFQALRQARANPGAGHGDLLGSLLGKPAAAKPGIEAAPAPAPAAGIDALIRSIVAPHIVQDTSAQTMHYQAAIDAATTEQMRALLHEPAFQALESAWRGVQWLVSRLELDENLQLHLFDVSKEELASDFMAAQGDLSRSGLTLALCGPATDTPDDPGWSLLVGLSGFGPGADDLGLLAALGAVAAQAGGPLVATAAPALYGCGSVTDLPDPMLWAPLATEAARHWSELRASAVAPWIGLVAPRLLLRLPYGKATDPIEQFAFEEQVGAPVHETLLWGAGSLVVALLAGQAFTEGGRDLAPDHVTELADLPAYTFRRDDQAELQPCAEAWLGERAGQALLERGLMPLLSHHQRAAVRLMRMQSIADPPCALAGGQD